MDAGLKGILGRVIRGMVGGCADKHAGALLRLGPGGSFVDEFHAGPVSGVFGLPRLTWGEPEGGAAGTGISHRAGVMARRLGLLTLLDGLVEEHVDGLRRLRASLWPSTVPASCLVPGAFRRYDDNPMQHSGGMRRAPRPNRTLPGDGP